MDQTEKFSLRWSEFEETVSQGLRDLHSAGQLHDVTLILEDGELHAHRVILASCSTFFRRVLVSCIHHSPLFYLRGVSSQDLTSILEFMYQGEVSISQDRLASFLAVAEDLQVKGLTNSDSKASTPPPRVNRRKMHSSLTSSINKKPRTESPGSSTKHSENVSVNAVDNNAEIVQVKAEPASVIDTKGSETSTSKLTGSESRRSQEVSSRVRGEESDFNTGYGIASYNDYQEDGGGYDEDISIPPVHFGGSGITFPFVNTDQENVRNRRQLILQFITANKGRLSDTYVCLICNKQVTDNSNMNKHLEFKHGSELKLFLQSLSL